MVAPHLGTQLTRSLVRVPNSGRDRHAGAVLHDLSRVSSAAALVPITSYLAVGLRAAAISAQPSLLPNTSSMKLAGRVVPAGGSRAAIMNSPIVESMSGATYSPPTPEVYNPPMAGIVSNFEFPSETPDPPRPAPTPGSALTTVNPDVGRKRQLSLMVQNASPIAEGRRSSKVSRSTIHKTSQPLRLPASRHRAQVSTMEQLLRESNGFPAENLALRQPLARRQHKHKSTVEPVGLQAM